VLTAWNWETHLHAIYNFGDSNSDNGGILTVAFVQVPREYGEDVLHKHARKTIMVTYYRFHKQPKHNILISSTAFVLLRLVSFLLFCASNKWKICLGIMFCSSNNWILSSHYHSFAQYVGLCLLKFYFNQNQL
jgi:hypothetical protein